MGLMQQGAGIGGGASPGAGSASGGASPFGATQGGSLLAQSQTPADSRPKTATLPVTVKAIKGCEKDGDGKNPKIYGVEAKKVLVVAQIVKLEKKTIQCEMLLDDSTGLMKAICYGSGEDWNGILEDLELKQYVTVCGNIREPKGGGNPFLGVMSISAAKPDDIAVHLADVAYWSLYHLRGVPAGKGGDAASAPSQASQAAAAPATASSSTATTAPPPTVDASGDVTMTDASAPAAPTAASTPAAPVAAPAAANAPPKKELREMLKDRCAQGGDRGATLLEMQQYCAAHYGAAEVKGGFDKLVEDCDMFEADEGYYSFSAM